jgi:hypothetical protein
MGMAVRVVYVLYNVGRIDQYHKVARQKAMVLTRNSSSECRTEPVSATPMGERTIVISIRLASDRRVKSSGLILPAYSGTAEQIVFCVGISRKAPFGESYKGCSRSLFVARRTCCFLGLSTFDK